MANKLSKVVAKSKGGKQKPVPVKIVNDAPRPSYAQEDMKYKAQDAIRTLQRAEEIKRDKPLMRAAKAEAKSMMKQLSTVVSK